MASSEASPTIAASVLNGETTREAPGGALIFAGVTLAVAVLSCAVAGWAPLGFSIATVFLFAGPHNWFEARYMLGRMPAKWGPLRTYFLFGLLGVPALAALFAATPAIVNLNLLAAETTTALWNTVFITWLATLAWMRSHQPPRRNWNWVIPAAFTLIALNWLWPFAWSLALVYIHPLVALCFLDRELARHRKSWSTAYRCCLAALPLLLGALWWNLADAPNLPGQDSLTLQVTHHAGGSVLQGVSTHLLVATHTFLEMLHYGVWILAIPLLSVRAWPWQISDVPLARKSPVWRRFLLAVAILGLLVMTLLWAGFIANYPLTRDVYFTVAVLHVLAEFPFLLRLL